MKKKKQSNIKQHFQIWVCGFYFIQFGGIHLLTMVNIITQSLKSERKAIKVKRRPNDLTILFFNSLEKKF